MLTRKSTMLNVTRLYTVPPETIYDAFIEPEKARKFFFATIDGEMVRYQIDYGVGGKFIFTDRRDGEDVDHFGTYLELERPSRIVFSFSVPKYSAGEDRVEINIVRTDEGSEVNLLHEFDAAYEDRRDMISHGWTTMLNALADTVGSK